MSHYVLNTRTNAVVLKGTQAGCLSAADAWNKASPRTFVVHPLTHQQPERPTMPTKADRLCDEYLDWCEQEGLPSDLSSDELLLQVEKDHQRQWLERFIGRWDAIGNPHELQPMLPERVATMANLLIDTMSDVQRHDLRMGRRDEALGEALHQTARAAYGYVVADCAPDEVREDSHFKAWLAAAVMLADACHWAAPYRMQVIDAKSGTPVLDRHCTMGYFTEDEQFTHEEMVAINALGPGATYVREGLTAILRVTLEE